MKLSKIILGLFLLIILTAINNFAQEITLTTTKENIVSSRTTIDIPALYGNPNAIIVATPTGNTATSNPHPIGAYYYNGKWHIFNTDHAVLAVGLTFRVQVFARPDANHFLHQITKENLIGGGSYLDNPVLNNNPNAQVAIFQNHSPDNRVASLNRNEAKAEYNPTLNKWYIKNVKGESLYPNTAYNVVISSIGDFPKTSVKIPELNTKAQVNSSDNSVCNCPSTLPPNGNAAGDLGGTYPNPKVTGLNGRPLSNAVPKAGQVLRWSETSNTWGYDNAYSVGGGGLSLDENNVLRAINTNPIWNANQLAGRDIKPTAPTIGQVLRWNGTAWEPSSITGNPSGNNNAPNDAATKALIDQMLAKQKEQQDAINTIQSVPANKPSVLHFNQSGNSVSLSNPNVNILSIPGLDNQTLTLSQSSRVVFQTTAQVQIYSPIQANATGFTLYVEILNSANTVTARSVSYGWLTQQTPQTIVSVGIGVLPAGTYKTKVWIKRQVGGANLIAFVDNSVNQGSQMILQIFPD